MGREEGQFLVEDYFLNTGGLNTADSPFMLDRSQAADGLNFDYVRRGGIRKRPGHAKLNTVADAELRTKGLGLWDKPGSSRVVIRAAEESFQRFDAGSQTFTTLTDDTSGAASSLLNASSEVPVVTSMFNTPTTGVLWAAGGGLESIVGAYSSTKLTENGVPVPTASSFTATPVGSGGSLTTGTYRYTLVYRKASTQATSNAELEVSATCTTNDSVTLAWTLTNVDTTRFDKIYLYRSALNGAAAFTTGDLVAILPSTDVGYLDTGTSEDASTSVPRAASLTVDDSVLPDGTYKVLTTWKRRLVTASGSTLYFSDVNKPESWPTLNTITVPSGGDITGLAVISYNSNYGGGTDEFLCVFKQRELWIVTGTALDDWALKFVDNSGCPNQSLVVQANGYIAWVGIRGVYMWAGTGKAAYMSQSIEDKFQTTGDIDKAFLPQGFGVFFQARNEIEWFLSSSAYGEQKYVLKLDLRLTSPSSTTALDDRAVQGIFTPDVTNFPCYAGLSLLPAADSASELLYLGDASGFIYSGYVAVSEAGGAYSFEYVTPYLDMDRPGGVKRLQKVVAWVLETSVYDLTLDYWSNYRYADGDGNSITRSVTTAPTDLSLLWDSGSWDVNTWDGGSQRVRAVEFNVGSGSTNSNEGDSFRLKFSQSSATDQVILYGFSIYYTNLGVRK